MQGPQDTDRTKMDDRDYRVNCFECGCEFEAARSDASFCSTRCRVAHSRNSKRLEKRIKQVGMMAEQLRQWSLDNSHSDELYKAYQALDAQLMKALNNFEA